MATDLSELLAACKTQYPESFHAVFTSEVKRRARSGDLLCYIYYVHGHKHPDIRSYCFSPHARIMADYLATSPRTMIVAHPESGKSLLHASEMELWIGMQTERSFTDKNATVPSAAWVMGTFENQAEPQVSDIRETIENNAFFRELFPRCEPDKRKKWEAGKWFLKRPRGKNRKEATLTAYGCEGDMQGLRYGKVTVDDPISQQDAKSEKIVRDRVRWILATLENRVLEEGDTRYVFTRWAERDLFPPLANSMPTLVMPVYGFWKNHPEYGCSENILWFDKWTPARVEMKRQILIDAGEAPLFDLVWMCNPKLAEGNLFKRAWLRYGRPREEVAV